MTPLEIIALIFIALSLIKLIFITVNKKSWASLASNVYSNKLPATIIFSIIAVVILFFLSKELTLAQIISVVAFTSILVGLKFLQYPNETSEMLKNIGKKKLPIGIIFYIIIWILFMILTLIEIFS